MVEAGRTLELGPERSLHIVMAGEGHDIVLLHGGFATHQDWLTGIFQSLSGLGRTIAVDRPGHGLSRRRRNRGAPRDQAAQIHEGLRALGVERPVLVGHSLGGLVALAYAEQYPEALSHLVLIGPIAFPELRPIEHSMFAPRATLIVGPVWAGIMAGTLDRPILEIMHRLMFAPDKPHEKWKRSYPWKSILDPDATVATGEDFAAIHPLAPDAKLDIESIRTPAHVLSGMADLIVEDLRQAVPLGRMLPNARHSRFEGVGHMLHHSKADAVLDAVREALGRAS